MSQDDPEPKSKEEDPYEPPLASEEIPEPAERRGGDRKWWTFLVLYFAAAFYFIVVSSFIGALLPVHEAVLATQIVGVLGAAVWYTLIRSEQRAPWPKFDEIGMSVGQLVLMAVTACVLVLAANSVMALIVETVPAAEPIAKAYEEQVKHLLLEAEGVDWVMGVVGITVLAPICEEILFRGTILPEQQRVQKTLRAVGVNGLLFGAFHLNPIALISLTFVGMFLAHLVALTGSIWPAIIAHAVFNAFSGVVLPAAFPNAGTTEIAPLELLDGVYVLGAVGQLVAAGIVFGTIAGILWRWLARSVAASQ